MGLFDFRTPAQRRESEQRYEKMIFPRGKHVRDELSAIIGGLCPKSRVKWVMFAYVTGKEGVIRLRDGAKLHDLPMPTREAEREAAVKHINPERMGLSTYEVGCALALVFSDIAADAGEPMPELSELKALALQEQQLI